MIANCSNPNFFFPFPCKSRPRLMKLFYRVHDTYVSFLQFPFHQNGEAWKNLQKKHSQPYKTCIIIISIKHRNSSLFFYFKHFQLLEKKDCINIQKKPFVIDWRTGYVSRMTSTRKIGLVILQYWIIIILNSSKNILWMKKNNVNIYGEFVYTNIRVHCDTHSRCANFLN